MKYLVIVIFSIIFQVHCRSLSSTRLTDTQDNQMDFNEERSARVHRVSDDGYDMISLENAESDIPEDNDNEKVINEKLSRYPEKSTEFPVTGEHKHQSVLPQFSEDIRSDDYDQREAKLLKQLTLIFKELSGAKGAKLKNFDMKINEIKDTMTSHGKPQSNDIDSLLNTLRSRKELDMYYQDNQKKDGHVKTRYEEMLKSPSSFHFKLLKGDEEKAIESNERYLDDMLMSVQNQMNLIRSDFEKLCRKHHAMGDNRSPKE